MRLEKIRDYLKSININNLIFDLTRFNRSVFYWNAFFILSLLNGRNPPLYIVMPTTCDKSQDVPRVDHSRVAICKKKNLIFIFTTFQQ